MRIVLLPQIQSVTFPMVRGIDAAPTRVGVVRTAPVCQMAPEEQDITRMERHLDPFVAILPGLGDGTAVRELDVHPVRAGNYFNAAVLRRGLVYGKVGRQVLDPTDVVVGRGVQVGGKPVARRELVVDLVLEQEHVLHISHAPWLAANHNLNPLPLPLFLLLYYASTNLPHQKDSSESPPVRSHTASPGTAGGSQRSSRCAATGGCH